MPLGRWTPALVDRLRRALRPTESDGDAATEPSTRTDGSGTERDGWPAGPPASHPDPILRIDANGRIVAANDPAEAALGGAGSIVGSRLRTHLDPPLDEGDLDREGEGPRRRFEPHVIDDAADTADGERLIHLRRTPDTADGGTARPQSTDARAQRRTFEQYETIMQVLPDPVYATDETGTLTFVNRAFEERFGIDRATVAESNVHFSEITTEDGAAAIARSLRALLDADDPNARATVESVAVTGDGRHLAVENSLALRPSRSGFAGAAGVMRDVTERQRREEILSVMDRALRHNLRTNVNIIAGYAETVEPAVEDDHVEALRTIKRSATWLGKLGETIRTLEQSIDETLETSGTVDIEGLIEGCADWAREEYPSADIDVTISAYGAIDAGDPLEIALQNVIENAIVHNDADTPSVDIWVTDAPQEQWVELSVADDGPGIPDEERAIVLGTAMPTQLTHGSGLGLWLASWIVQVFDGDIEIQDNDPRGSVVTLRLRRMLGETA